MSQKVVSVLNLSARRPASDNYIRERDAIVGIQQPPAYCEDEVEQQQQHTDPALPTA